MLERIQAGRLRSVTASQLSHTIVTVLTREQEDFVETLTKDVWQLEQRLTGGNVGDPEQYLDELFRARHGLLDSVVHHQPTVLGAKRRGAESDSKRVPPRAMPRLQDLFGGAPAHQVV